MTTKVVGRIGPAVSFLFAIPPVVLADDTLGYFTTSANPNVLLMLDTTGSMADISSGTPVGDLDGRRSNTKMDILWKVVYTLLNADLSQPSHVTSDTVTVVLAEQRAPVDSTTIDTNISSSRRYQYVEVTTALLSPSNCKQRPLESLPRFPTSTGNRTDRVGGQSETSGGATLGARDCLPADFYFTSATSASFEKVQCDSCLISFLMARTSGSALGEGTPTEPARKQRKRRFLNNASAWATMRHSGAPGTHDVLQSLRSDRTGNAIRNQISSTRRIPSVYSLLSKHTRSSVTGSQ